MKKEDFGNYLASYYQNRLHLFHTHLDKAIANSNEENIHDFRVDIKTLRAVFLFFELLFPEKFKSEKFNQKFPSVFKNAGKIREIQINHNYLSHYKLSPSIVKQYNFYLKEKENLFNDKFKKSINHFKIDPFTASLKIIKKLVKTISNKEIIKKCYQFLHKEAEQIKQLLDIGKNSAIMHKIRMRMKLLSYVTPFLYEFNPNKKLEKVLGLIKKSNALIGDWHDELMLIYSLEKFAIKTDTLGGKHLISVITLVDDIKKENEMFFEKIKNKIKNILKNIHTILKEQSHFKIKSINF